MIPSLFWGTYMWAYLEYMHTQSRVKNAGKCTIATWKNWEGAHICHCSSKGWAIFFPVWRDHKGYDPSEEHILYHSRFSFMCSGLFFQVLFPGTRYKGSTHCKPTWENGPDAGSLHGEKSLLLEGFQLPGSRTHQRDLSWTLLISSIHNQERTVEWQTKVPI